MTSFRDLFRERQGIGRRFTVAIEATEDGRLVADHPIPESDYDLAVVEGLDRLPERPPEEPIEVEILGRFVDERLAARVVDSDGDSVEQRDPIETDAEDGNSEERD